MKCARILFACFSLLLTMNGYADIERNFPAPVNAQHGNYCEASIDLPLTEDGTLALERHYSQKAVGTWTLSPHLGSDKHIAYSRDPQGLLKLIEVKNSPEDLTSAWVHFDHMYDASGGRIHLITHDGKEVNYQFTPFPLSNNRIFYALTHVSGTDIAPCTYEYQVQGDQCLLVRKILSDGRFIAFDYDEANKIQTIQDPYSLLDKSRNGYFLNYGEGYTDVLDAQGELIKRVIHKQQGDKKTQPSIPLDFPLTSAVPNASNIIATTRLRITGSA